MNDLKFANAVEKVFEQTGLTSVYVWRGDRKMRIISDITAPQFGFWQRADGRYNLSLFEERGGESYGQYFASDDIEFMSLYILVVSDYFIRRGFGLQPVYIPTWEIFIQPGFPWYRMENGFRVEWTSEGRRVEAIAECEPDGDYVQLTQYAEYSVERLIELLRQERPSELFVSREDLVVLREKYGEVLPVLVAAEKAAVPTLVVTLLRS